MRTPALLTTLLLSACSMTASPPPPPPTTSGGQWGQPVEGGASAPLPLRARRDPVLQCVPEGGDCGPAEAQCCAGYTCAGLNRSICISKH